MQVRGVDPGDDHELVRWQGVLQASDRELWPDLQGYGVRDVKAFARFTGTTRRYVLLVAEESAGPFLGVAMVELPERDNRHAAEVTVAVHPAHRRKGVGSALVEHMGTLARSDGRRTLNTIVDLPLARARTHASVHFAPQAGFVSTLAGNTRHLHLPADPTRLDELRIVVATARRAADYRTFTFEAPWPDELVEDHCALQRVMSTDEPAGDGEREEEVWDATRVRENDALRRARGATALVAAARHLPTDRVVAMSEILLSGDAPHLAWQMVTVVDPGHRGHRLGLAVKLANLASLTRRAPAVRLVSTGNAQVNAPMISVNDMLGFVVAGEGLFWQKHLGEAT